MNVYLFIDYSKDIIEAQPVTSDDDTVIGSILIDTLMDGVLGDVITRSGGYHDNCDILETEALPWYRMPERVKDEMLEAEAKAWAKRQGYTVEEVTFI